MKTFKLPRNNIIDPDNEYFTGRNDTNWNSAGRRVVMEMIQDKKAVIVKEMIK